MKILFLAQLLPYPPDNGGRIKNFNMLKGLAEEHDIILASFIRSEDEKELLQYLKPYCSEIHTVIIRRSTARNAYYLMRSLPTSTPFLIARDFSLEMKRLVDKLLATDDFDAVHIDQLNMAQYVEEFYHITRILDQQNVVSAIVDRGLRVERSTMRKAIMYIEQRKLAKYEKEVCESFDAVFTVSEADKDLLQKMAPRQDKYYAIPIGVDLESYSSVGRIGNKDLLFIGTMYWPPNIDGIIWFCDEIFPLIIEGVSDVNLRIVGSRAPKEVRRLEKDRRVSIEGYVPNLEPLVAKSSVLVVPLRVGSGMRVKILNALAWGIPVVSTSIGCEGIQVTHGENIMIADDEKSFAKAVLKIISDKEFAECLAQNGRKFVETRHSWSTIYHDIRNAYREIVLPGRAANRLSAQ